MSENRLVPGGSERQDCLLIGAPSPQTSIVPSDFSYKTDSKVKLLRISRQ